MSSSTSHVQPSANATKLLDRIHKETGADVKPLGRKAQVKLENSRKDYQDSIASLTAKIAKLEADPLYVEFDRLKRTAPTSPEFQQAMDNANAITSLHLKYRRSMVPIQMALQNIDKEWIKAGRSGTKIDFSQLTPKEQTAFEAVGNRTTNIDKVNKVIQRFMPDSDYRVGGNEPEILTAISKLFNPSPIIEYFCEHKNKVTREACTANGALILSHAEAYNRQKMAQLCVTYPSYMNTLPTIVQDCIRNRAGHVRLTHPNHLTQSKLSFEDRFIKPVNPLFSDDLYERRLLVLNTLAKDKNLPELENGDLQIVADWMAENGEKGDFVELSKEVSCLYGADEGAKMPDMPGFDTKKHKKVIKKPTPSSKRRKKKSKVSVKVKLDEFEQLISESQAIVNAERSKSKGRVGKMFLPATAAAALEEVNRLSKRQKLLQTELDNGTVKPEDTYSSPDDDSSVEDIE